jgi:hypothetical protein
LPRYFGRRLMMGEALVYRLLQSVCDAYSAGFSDDFGRLLERAEDRCAILRVSRRRFRSTGSIEQNKPTRKAADSSNGPGSRAR